MRQIPLVLLALLLVSCGGEGPGDRADPSVEYLVGRFAKLRPAIEEVLGKPYGESPTFVEATRVRRVSALAAEITASHCAIAGGPRGDDLRQLAEARAAILAVVRPLHLDPVSREILFDREAFTELARLSPEPESVLSVGYLDVLVIHEAVLLSDHRRYDPRHVIGVPASEETLACREAVYEGHAQFVGRRVIETFELWPYFDLMRMASSRLSAELMARPDVEVRKQVLGRLGHSLIQGERFVDDVVVRLGYEPARERIFSDPPRSIAELRTIDQYLGRPKDPEFYRRAARDLLPLVRREGYRAELRSLSLTELHAACAVAGAPAVTQGMAGVSEAVVLTLTGDSVPSHSIVLVIVSGGSEEGSAAYFALHREVLVAKSRNLPEGTKILSSVHGDVEIENGSGVSREWKIQPVSGAAPVVLRILAAIRGRFTIEVTSNGPTDDRGELVRLASRVLTVLAK